MALAVYLDECVNRHLARLLQDRGIRAVTALESQTLGLDDEAQLAFATSHDLAIVSHNQRHFQKLHDQVASTGRAHGGILLLPAGPLPLVSLRTSMLVVWVSSQESIRSRLMRWHDLQGELTQGHRLAGFSEMETRQALTIEPMEPPSTWP